MLIKNDIIIYDLETTGLDVDNCAIVEIAAVRFRVSNEGGETLDRFETLVIPRVDIEPGAFDTHGISMELAKTTGKRLSRALREFAAFCGPRPALLAHNGIAFDHPILAREMSREGVSLGNPQFLDSILIAKRALGVVESCALGNLVREFGIELAPGHRAHRAMADVEALVEFLKAGIKKYGGGDGKCQLILKKLNQRSSEL